MAEHTQDAMGVVGDRLAPKVVDTDQLEAAVELILTALGQASNLEVMENTPRRVANMYAEIINPAWCDIEIPWKCFDNPGVEDVIVISGCHYVSFCEHHLAPALGMATLGYVPDKLITGYSKVKKALNYLSRQPQLNERLLVSVLDTFEEVVQPRGVSLRLQSVHLCLACKSNGPAAEVVTVEGHRGACRVEPYRSEALPHDRSSLRLIG